MYNPVLSDKLHECMRLWGEPKQVHMQNTEQLPVHDRHQSEVPLLQVGLSILRSLRGQSTLLTEAHLL